MRTLLHPGEPRAERASIAIAPAARRIATVFPEGATIQTALAGLIERFDARCGCIDFVGGRLTSAKYHVAVARASGPVVEYGPPIALDGGAWLVRANGSFGDDLHGRPRLHVHGVLADAGGRAHGGHIDPFGCAIGPGGIRAIVQFDVGFVQASDPETGLDLFFPTCGAA